MLGLQHEVLYPSTKVAPSENLKLADKVLMVAFHFPPYEGGSGVHRTLKFSRYLVGFGWTPIVLSAHTRAYPRVGKDQVGEILRGMVVKRAFAFDSAKHLSVWGRYSRLSALPDQWVSWWAGAIVSGLRLVRKYRPQVIWSTYPIATAHLIGLTLHRLTGIPWIADFRDSMTEDDYPRDRLARRSYLWIERQTVKQASRLIFTAPSTKQMYLDRYPQLSTDRCVVIANGFDEEDFAGIQPLPLVSNSNGHPTRLLHAGLIYPEERDPRPFFRALSRLKMDGIINAKRAVIDLRASGSEDYYAAMLKELKIDDVVRLLPALPYRKALEDCARADAFLLFQAESCNHQIPAKAYEYLRLGKPILALTPVGGDTAKLLEEVGGATIVDLAQEDEIYRAIPRFLISLRDSTHAIPDAQRASRYSRKYQAFQLSQCLSEVLSKE
jgi:glycosyltransferase involved in cell wall biosynthesis